ncbi:MAG: SurA N-terminal domain-containing protein [Elusimicrobiales bacterium]|nr:SurA N-terminal domain-containing protein [Elusimicrobiales bacterium]
MIGFFNKYKKIIFTITVVAFVVSIFFGLGAYIGEITIGDTVAKIGNKRISFKHYQKMVSIAMNNLIRENKKIDSDEAYKVVEKMVKEEVFKELIVEEILKMESKKFKFKISDFEVAMEIQNTQAFLIEDKFDPRLYVNTVWSNYRMTSREYEEWRRGVRLANRFKSFIFENIKVSPDEIAFYKQFIKNEKIKDENQFLMTLKQQKFYDVTNHYLRSYVSKIEIQDFRKKFEKDANS